MQKRKKNEKSIANLLKSPDQTKGFQPCNQVQNLLIKKMLAEIRVKSDPEHDIKLEVKPN